MCLIVNGYWSKAVWMFLISWPNSIIFLFVELDKEGSLQKEGDCTRGIAC